MWPLTGLSATSHGAYPQARLMYFNNDALAYAVSNATELGELLRKL